MKPRRSARRRHTRTTKPVSPSVYGFKVTPKNLRGSEKLLGVPASVELEIVSEEDVLPDAVLYADQDRMWPDAVEAYRLRIRAGEHPGPVISLIRDRNGNFHINNGCHRLAAYRLEGLAAPVEVWGVRPR